MIDLINALQDEMCPIWIWISHIFHYLVDIYFLSLKFLYLWQPPCSG